MESMSLHLYELNKWYWDILADTIVEWCLKVQNHIMVWGVESICKHCSWVVILVKYYGLGFWKYRYWKVLVLVNIIIEWW